jgi:hypothetical protein
LKRNVEFRIGIIRCVQAGVGEMSGKRGSNQLCCVKYVGYKGDSLTSIMYALFVNICMYYRLTYCYYVCEIVNLCLLFLHD